MPNENQFNNKEKKKTIILSLNLRYNAKRKII